MRTALQAGRWLRVGWERRFFLSNVLPKSDDRLLDIGSGTGFFLAAAAQRGWAPYGVEASFEAANLGMEVHRRPIQVGRIEDVEFENGWFSAVTAWEVMEHLPHPLDFLRLVSSMLCRNGVFAGSVPNYARPRYRYGTDLGPASVPPVHLSFWTPPALERLLRNGGFNDVQVYVPRFEWDVLRPVRAMRARKLVRFAKIVLSQDLPTTMAFIATRS
jgi:SAM-dependent methyltransferase